ncbi:FAD-dependent oxidoreductase [Jannaschia helgolandensis]|uniref:Rieske [2Fe-2S] domain-containing protein n=1 Tax=Jannaschia helgolandensis TaxID=188906 RepID=A0A1H7GH86_9RHOB|nr:FAD-dependent oxidoreductase [Jannaschia helgolandensis]SEK37444.1 Rieske [2Fe-2S] domain-containing protein [Jannaschia helgolandensis]
MTQIDIALADIPEGVPHQPDGAKVILIRTGDDVTALAHLCPHYGLPLAKGVVRDGTLICAFHHACFNARTGRQIQPPGHADLRRYTVTQKDGRVIVDIPDTDLHLAPDHARLGLNPERIVIVGAGAAGNTCAKTLREMGFEGIIQMISPDGLPLDRTMLSKAVLSGSRTPDDAILTDADTLADLDVTLVSGQAVAIEPGQVVMADGGRHAFDKLLIAPGGRPNRPDLPGVDLPGVHTLRSGADAAAISQATETTGSAVLIGGGFIGLEGALSLAKRGLSVTVAMREQVPLARILGERLGRIIQDEHEAKGITFVPGASLTSVTGKDNATGVTLETGETIDADLVLLAMGVTPATDAIDGLRTQDDGGVVTGPGLSVPGLSGVYVAGDCAVAPTPFGTARIEHWRVACQHGRNAALAMLGQGVPLDIPFFWTALGRQYRYLGYAEDWDEIEFDGDPTGPFLARYIKDGQVRAAVTAGRDADLAALHLEMLAAGGPIPA